MFETNGLLELNEKELVDLNGGSLARDIGYMAGTCVAELWDATVYAYHWWTS